MNVHDIIDANSDLRFLVGSPSSPYRRIEEPHALAITAKPDLVQGKPE